RVEVVGAGGRIGIEAAGAVAGHYRGVVGVGGEHVVPGLLVGVLDHGEQGLFLVHPVNRPGGVEDLVAAVLGIGLGKHHQLHVGGVAAEGAEAVVVVVDLVVGEGEAEAGVGLHQGRATAADHIHPGEGD